MEFLLRYFIDGNVNCEGHEWSYAHAARMIIPRIGERVWVDDDKLYMVDIECHDITEAVLAEYDEEEY